MKKYCFYVLFFGLILYSKFSFALEFQSGVGVGLQYTDNAQLAPDDKVTDVIATGLVGASIAEDDGLLSYSATGSLRKEDYTHDTFDDQRYLNLGANLNWEMLRERLTWFLSDEFSQAPVTAIDSDTPDNRQDSNIFVLGANIDYPITGLQKVRIIPQFRQSYYEVSNTNNNQYSLAANWNYQVFRLTSVGLSLGVRKINYDDRSIADVDFTDYGFIVSGRRVSSSYSVNLGGTNVKRDNGEESSGPVGSLNWTSALSSRSTIDALVLTEITDTTSVSQGTAPGDSNDVQLSTDVIRNSLIGLTYTREDAALHSRIWAEYRKIKYSDNTNLNNLVQKFGAKFDFPVKQLVTSGVFVSFDNTKREEIFREDKHFNVGVNVHVTHTNKLSSSFDVQYRTKESTNSLENYDEFSVFASLNYGFGKVTRRNTYGGS